VTTPTTREIPTEKNRNKLKGSIRFVVEYEIKNQDEKIVSILIFDDKGVLIQDCSVQDGYIVERSGFNEKVISEIVREDNTIKRVKSIKTGQHDVTILQEFNSVGDIVEEEIREIRFFVNEYEETDCDFNLSTTTFQYEYDEQNNWILKREIENGIVTSIRKRSIIYSPISHSTDNDTENLPF
jgi:hypothetical protein